MLPIYIEVPFATFAMPQTRSCVSSYPVPPPSTCYGTLLALVGETDPTKHAGCGLSIFILGKPDKFQVIRKIHQNKFMSEIRSGGNSKANVRPKIVYGLHDVRIVVYLDNAEDKNRLEDRVSLALDDWGCDDLSRRFGVLSLGESKNMINHILKINPDHFSGEVKGLFPSERGLLALPVWPNYVNPSAAKYALYEMRKVQGIKEVPQLTIMKP